MPMKNKTSITCRKRTLKKVKMVKPDDASYDEWLNEKADEELVGE